MPITKILVTIEPDDDIDVEEYMDAVELACLNVATRPMIGRERTITVDDVTDGKGDSSLG